MKRPALWVLAGLLAALALLAAAPGRAAPPTPILDPVRVTDYVLVETTGGPPPAAAGRAEHLFHHWYRLYLSPGQSLDRALTSAAALPGVLASHADKVVQVDATAALVPGDPHYARQWHMPQVQAEAAWDVTDGAGVVIAILDTGVDTAGSDGLCLPLHSEVDFTPPVGYTTGPGVADDAYSHGTHVAGTAAGCTGNGLGVVGLAYGAQVMAVKVLNNSGGGTLSDVAAGIVWAADHGAGVINMSLGSSCSANFPTCSSAIVNDAIEHAAAADVVIVASAGNSNKAFVGQPGNHPEILAISATDYARARAYYSSWGDAVDLAAPGGDTGADLDEDGYGDGVLQETFNRSTGVWGYYYKAGTSMAAPHVAGAAALVRACAPEATRDDVRAALLGSADDLGAPGYDTVFGHGFLQIRDALDTLAAQFGRDPANGCAFIGPTPCLTVSTAIVGDGDLDISPNPDCDAGGAPGYTFGTTLSVAATPGPGHWFAGWNGGATGTASPLLKTLYRDLSLTATFTPCLTVSATADGPGTVGVAPAPNCGGAGYSGGTVVSLSPTPDPGYYFDHWSGDASGTAKPLNVTLSDNLSVSATFAACLSVTTHSDGPGAVTVSPAPNCAGGANYNGRTSLTLTAAPDPGYVFGGWSGGASGAANPLTLTLLADLDVTAAFDEPPRVAVSLPGDGNAGGLAYRDEDVLERDGAAWTMRFDGSAHALPGDVDALAILPDGDLLLSTDAPVKNLPGIGAAAVDDSDVVRYDTATQTYSWYFDGSDVGLTTAAEDVDALALLPDGRLLISTLGAASVPARTAADEDVLVFNGTLGSNTTNGSWAVYLDGSDLSGALVDVDGVAIYGSDLYLSAVGTFSLGGQSVAPGDVFVCRGHVAGQNSSCTTLARFWQASANGLGAANVDALEMLAP